MSKELAEQLVKLLADETQAEWERSAKALDLVFEWNHEIFTSQSGNRVNLIRALVDFVKALSTGQESLSGISSLMDQAYPSPELQKKVESLQKTLAAKRNELKTLENQVHELERLENENRALIVEKGKLQERKQELAAVETFDGSVVTDLQKQVHALEGAKPWLSNLVELQKKLHDDLPKLNRLSGEALMALQEEDRKELKNIQNELEAIKSEASQQVSALDLLNDELTDVRTQISEHQKRYEDAKQELTQRSEILKHYIKIDKEIAKVINNNESKKALDIMDELEKGMKNVDEALRLAIETNEKASKVPFTPFSE